MIRASAKLPACGSAAHGTTPSFRCATWDVPLLPKGDLNLEQIKPECLNFPAGHEVEERFAPSSENYSGHFRDLAEVTLLCRCVDGWIDELV